MGRIESGSVTVGDEVVVLPSGLRSKVKEIITFSGNLPTAFTPQSVTITLEDDIDVSRGDILARPKNLPRCEQEFEAALCWMAEEPMRPRKKYIVKHTTRQVRGFVTELRYRIDVDSLHRDETATELQLNEIGRCIIRTQKPIYCDDYRQNRSMGSFILIDELTNQTVAAGMIWRERHQPPEVEG